MSFAPRSSRTSFSNAAIRSATSVEISARRTHPRSDSVAIASSRPTRVIRPCFSPVCSPGLEHHPYRALARVLRAVLRPTAALLCLP